MTNKTRYKQHRTTQAFWGAVILGGVMGSAVNPWIAALIAALGTHQSWEKGTPFNAVRACFGLLSEGCYLLFNREWQFVDVPAERINGALAKPPGTGIAKQTPLSGWFGYKGNQKLGTDWLLDMALENNIGLLGDEGEGKSYVLRLLAYEFVKRHNGNCRLFIHDIEDGYGHDDEPFDWFGLKKGQFLFTDAHDLPALLTAALDDSKLPTLVLVDELNNAMDELDDDEKADVRQGFKALRNRGKKRKTRFVIGTQDGDVGSLGLNSAAIRKLVWVVFPLMAFRSSSYRLLDLTQDEKDNLAAVQGQLSAYKPKPGDHPVVVCHHGDISLRGIPHIEGLPKKLELFDSEPFADWFENWLANHPDFQPHSYQSATAIAKAINEVLRFEKSHQLTDEKLIETSEKRDRRYAAISRWWSQKSTAV